MSVNLIFQFQWKQSFYNFKIPVSQYFRLEYFAVIFNILLNLIYLFTDGLRLICWHASEENTYLFRVSVSLKLLLWSIVFLNLLPFKFLIPTLYGRKFHLWLNVFFWLWYGSGVWNSVSVLVHMLCYFDWVVKKT